MSERKMSRSKKLRGLASLILSIGFGSAALAEPGIVNCIAPGDYTFVLVWDLLPRTYLVHVPASYSGNSAVPLLLDLHGFSSYPRAQERQVSGQLPAIGQERLHSGLAGGYRVQLERLWLLRHCRPRAGR